MAHHKASPHTISFYFVLYLVAIITVFVITSERDTLLRKRDEDMARLIEIYVRPLKISPAIDTARFAIPGNQTATAEPLRLVAKSDGPIDREDIQYRLLSVKRLTGEGVTEEPASSGSVSNVNGDGVLTYQPLPEGVYHFQMSGYKPRIKRDGQSMRVMIRDTTYSVQYSERLMSIDLDTAVLIALVSKTGLEPIQLTLSTDRSHDTWVLGPPFTKRVFIAGAESPERVTIDAGGLRVERNPAERSFVTVIWDRTTLGPHAFTVSGNANRSLGQKDHASTTFSVDILPAAFVTPPPDHAYWGLPYVFDGQIVGVNPIELSVETLRNGQPAGVRPVVPKDTVVADRSVKNIAFRVMYHGASIKEYRVALEPPPPPQIRWLRQEIDRTRNAFIVTVACSDPIGGPVRMSLESQPNGIARIDKVRGTNFTITVSLEGKPSGVFLKLAAVDQYGGQAISTKQFNIQ